MKLAQFIAYGLFYIIIIYYFVTFILDIFSVLFDFVFDGTEYMENLQLISIREIKPSLLCLQRFVLNHMQPLERSQQNAQMRGFGNNI